MSPSTVSQTRGALSVYVTPKEPLDVDKFQQWRESSSIPGQTQKAILTATDALEGVKPYRYNIWYEIDDTDQIDENTIKSIFSSFPGTPASYDANLYELISFDHRDNLEARPPGTSVVWVGMSPFNTAESVKHYHDFYIDEHMPLLMKVPGWRCGTRYKHVTTFGKAKEYVAPFLTIHQYDEVNGLGGPEWKKSVTSARHAELLKHLEKPPHRRVWKTEPGSTAGI